MEANEAVAKPIGKVVFATPSLDRTVCSEYLISMMETIALFSQAGISADLSMIGGDCFVAKARNNIVTSFLQGDAETLFFIDADQGWEAQSALRMVLDPHEIVAGVPPKKTDTGPQYDHVFLDYDEQYNCYLENGLLRAHGVGTGFLRLKRSALEKLVAAYPETYSPGDGSPQAFHYNLFEAKVVDGKFWGEDLLFCNKWCDLDEKLWVDACCKFKHVGRKAWEGNFYEFLRSNATVVTAD